MTAAPDCPVPFTLTRRAYALLDAPAAAPVTIWRHVAALVAWLDAANPRTDHEIACRVMKLAEETGEAVAAYLGMTGQNPRKGTCATVDDLASELCDVIIAAMIALATISGGAASAETSLQDQLSARFARLLARTGTAPGPGQWGCDQCGAAFFGTPPEDGLCPACRAADGAR
jgi:rubrerythrin